MKNKLRIHRAIKEITQEELAAAVKVSRQTINHIETRKYLPSVILAAKLARYFGVTVDELFVLEDEDYLED